MDTVTYLEKLGLSVYKLNTKGKAKLTCKKCGWSEIRDIYNVSYGLKQSHAIACSSCRRIEQDNETLLFVQRHVKKYGGKCLVSQSHEARAERRYTHKTKVPVQVCGHVNSLSYDDALRGRTGSCNACARGSLTNKEIITLAQSKGMTISEKDIERCEERTYITGGVYKCGHRIKRMRLSHLKCRKTGECNSCIDVKRNREHFQSTVDDVKHFLDKEGLHPEIIIPNTGNSIVEYDCLICGKRARRSISYIRQTHRAICSECFGSRGECAIAHWLTERGILFEREKTFSDLWGHKKKLRFDFFLTNNQRLPDSMIEFDGNFHYDQELKATQNPCQEEYDEKKNEYCKKRGYPLLRIPYFQASKMDQMLEQFVTEIRGE